MRTVTGQTFVVTAITFILLPFSIVGIIKTSARKGTKSSLIKKVWVVWASLTAFILFAIGFVMLVASGIE